MEPGKLVQLAYSSTALINFDTEKLIHLLTTARQNNLEHNVTGILLYSEGDFFQILEGHENDVLHTFSKVKTDSRHNNVTQIIFEPVPSRTFKEWSMGFFSLNSEQISAIDGLNDFFTQGKCLKDLDTGRAKKLLNAFSNGYWRQSLK